MPRLTLTPAEKNVLLTAITVFAEQRRLALPEAFIEAVLATTDELRAALAPIVTALRDAKNTRLAAFDAESAQTKAAITADITAYTDVAGKL